jgi:protein associated with RNAse G/E
MSMKYSDEIDIIVQDSLKRLIKMKEVNDLPFNKAAIEKYYQMYKEIIAKAE